ncbi:hypothetical protein ACVJGD_008714 [Bradyrhizobium sp. USDA 10063]
MVSLAIHRTTDVLPGSFARGQGHSSHSMPFSPDPCSRGASPPHTTDTWRYRGTRTPRARTSAIQSWSPSESIHTRGRRLHPLARESGLIMLRLPVGVTPTRSSVLPQRNGTTKVPHLGHGSYRYPFDWFASVPVTVCKRAMHAPTGAAPTVSVIAERRRMRSDRPPGRTADCDSRHPLHE